MHSELEKFMKEYETANNSHDFNEVLRFVKDDAVYFYSDGTYRGLKEVKSSFEVNWETITDEVYSIKNIEWITVTENTASCVYDFQWKGKYHGYSFDGSGRGTNVLVKVDGEWKIIHEHLSKNPY